MKLNRLIPMLPVRSMPVSVEFYQNMLGFKVERRNDDWGWAMLCFDECRLMVDQSINAHPEAPRQFILYLYPDNVVEYHKQVRQNGLSAPELEITFYGLTEFRIVIQMGIACGSVGTRLLAPNNVLKGRRVKRAHVVDEVR